MRTIKQLSVPQDTNITKFPQGQIVNETTGVPGTPVIREIYGDVLTNIYKLLSDTGITPTGDEDSETSQFQILQALKLLANDLNDVQKVVSLSGTEWSVNFNIDNLPNNYVFIGKVSDSYATGVSYTFEGTGSNSYSFTSDTGFSASDDVLIILDQSGVKGVNLKNVLETTFVNTQLGEPIGYNSTNTVYYLAQGKLLTNTPSSVDIQSNLRVSESNVFLTIVEVIIFQGKLICLVLDTSTVTYSMFKFELNNLSSPASLTLSGFTFPTGVDNAPYMYADSGFIYLTNNSGNSVNDYDIHKLSFTNNTNTVTFVSATPIDSTFEKTTNAVVKNNVLFTFIENQLDSYSLTAGTKTSVNSFDIINGVIFSMNNNNYYSNGETGIKWTL